jgi:hypothetical protein
LPGEPLDLSGADTTAFDPIPSGQYHCRIDSYEWNETGDGGKMPEGTPRFSVQFEVISARDGSTEVDGMKVEGRKVFGNYFLPDSSYEKAAILKGIFTKFLVVATGEEESVITSGKYKIDYDDLIGKELMVSVAQQPRNDGSGDMQNNVRGVKAVGEVAEASGLL